MNTLHIYSPLYPHDDGFIVGDRESLGRLKDAIDYALLSPTGRKDFSVDAFANDGEGYSLRVMCADSAVMSTLEAHYTGMAMTFSSWGGISPDVLFLPGPPTEAGGNVPDVKPWDDPLS
jgi:hypothetical protein